MSKNIKTWDGSKQLFGLHYDLHANARDTELGVCATPENLEHELARLGLDFAQTDCKGHPGMTSWFSKTPDATVCPGLKKDLMVQWREATSRLGIPLHCHYSGIWDAAAAKRRPEWAVVPYEQRDTLLKDAGKIQKMCPRSGYIDELLIPQFKELIDRYNVDGFWIDGDMWAVEPCYCPRCLDSWEKQTGSRDAPASPADSGWSEWMLFIRRSFEDYVRHYCDVVHEYKPGIRICSNWLQTFANPGNPDVPTDWISGDNSCIWGLDRGRCEARFLPNRGKQWDIMIWAFYSTHGLARPTSAWTVKSAQMLQQEAAIFMSTGGSVQIYENGVMRDGRLIPWRIGRIVEVAEFIKDRIELCEGTETIPQIAVLHSEHHLYTTATGTNLMWDFNYAPVRGSVAGLLENHYGVDIFDEWALSTRVGEFPVVVVPEQSKISDKMVARLQDYVKNGGKLLLTGAELIKRFPADFIGAEISETRENATLYVPVGKDIAAIHSPVWAMLKSSTAEDYAPLGSTFMPGEFMTGFPGFTLNRVGKGAVGCIPCNLFQDFHNNPYNVTRTFIGECVKRVAGELDISVQAPVSVDVTLRQKEGRKIIHFINRASGIPNNPSDGGIDQIPNVGPISVHVKLPRGNYSVSLVFEDEKYSVITNDTSSGSELTVALSGVTIHNALVISPK
jgi:hypothetical protein